MVANARANEVINGHPPLTLEHQLVWEANVRCYHGDGALPPRCVTEVVRCGPTYDNSDDEEPEPVQLGEPIRSGVKPTTPTINQEYETAQRERDQQMADEYAQHQEEATCG